ncbi:hypothetical protein [Companilactobacillus sp. DQM5]|uniref:hypothetical protein n=1 Tax=Companilactobacillus sp. DQM5 TaxID=3463359 RepID=UPI0040592B28
MNNNYDPNLVNAFLKEYQDRGMMKWQGFYLSDHTVASYKRNKEKEIKSNRKHLQEMSVPEIFKELSDAQKNNSKVSVDLRQVNKNNILLEPVTGYIKGKDTRGVYIEEKYVKFEDIYSVFCEWHNVINV